MQALPFTQSANCRAGPRTAARDSLAPEDLTAVVAEVCHDLRNALAALSHQVELVRDEPTDVRTPQRLAVMLRTIRTAAGLLQRLDAAAPLSDGPQDLVDLGQILSDVAEITRFRWDRAAGDPRPPITLTLDLQPVPPVPGSAYELTQVFTNLVINACEALTAGGHVRLSTRFDGVHAVALVTDNGPGLRRETRDHLFERHFSTKGRGNSGLGLTIVAEIIGRHGGHVLADSARGEGTTFLVLLHVAPNGR